MSELTQVLRHLVPVDDPLALVDASTGDDAAVYRLSEDRALVVTADFFTPIVDDPLDFGRIAAANALSDLYAMGARPLFGLNLVGFPRSLLDTGLLERILEGGAEKCREAGIPILGGHTIDDPEPKFGMVAVGEVHPDRLVTNAAAAAGDVLVLTKPLGSGIVATAIKADDVPTSVADGAIRVMASLNRHASDVMMAHGVRCATDVTGFGLLGHLRSLLRASGRAAEVDASAVPLMDGALDLAGKGHVPGGSSRNLEDLEADLLWASEVAPAQRILLCDAQTSGGLLICCPTDRAEKLVRDLGDGAPSAAVIGEVKEGVPGAITIV
jgi:selenide,water dikinase